jgi:hypothetical protein
VDKIVHGARCFDQEDVGFVERDTREDEEEIRRGAIAEAYVY